MKNSDLPFLKRTSDIDRCIDKHVNEHITHKPNLNKHDVDILPDESINPLEGSSALQQTIMKQLDDIYSCESIVAMAEGEKGSLAENTFSSESDELADERSEDEENKLVLPEESSTLTTVTIIHDKERMQTSIGSDVSEITPGLNISNDDASVMATSLDVPTISSNRDVIKKVHSQDGVSLKSKEDALVLDQIVTPEKVHVQSGILVDTKKHAHLISDRIVTPEKQLGQCKDNILQTISDEEHLKNYLEKPVTSDSGGKRSFREIKSNEERRGNSEVLTVTSSSDSEGKR